MSRSRTTVEDVYDLGPDALRDIAQNDDGVLGQAAQIALDMVEGEDD